MLPRQAGEGDLAPLRDVGLNDEAILDVVQIVGYFNYINRVASALGVAPEPDWSPNDLD